MSGIGDGSGPRWPRSTAQPPATVVPVRRRWRAKATSAAQRVVLDLEVRERGERAQRQEARLEVADRPLHGALGRRPAGPQHDGPGMERAQEPADLGMEPRAAALARGDDRGVVVEHVGVGHAAEADGAAGAARAARHPPSGRG